MRSRAGSFFASMKASISGWSQRIVAIIAPRRLPADMIVRHIASQTSMKDKRTGGIRRHALHLGPARPDGGEIIADAAALLHGQRGFLQHLEDAAHAVGNRAHDEAVEQRHRPPGARPGGDPAGGQELEILQRRDRSGLPTAAGSASASARARAIRRQVSSTVPSIGVPSASFRRYFMSQICSAMGAENRDMGYTLGLWGDQARTPQDKAMTTGGSTLPSQCGGL